MPPNIAAAIRRSQEAREELRRRRRRNAAFVGALALAAPLSLAFADFGGASMVEAAVSKAQSLADMLNQRSPGERTAAQLTKTKHKQIALARSRPLVRKPAAPPLAPNPHELANILMPPPALVPAPLGQVAIGPPPGLDTIVAPPPGNSIVIPPGGGGGGTPGGGGGGTPGGGPPATNPTPPAIITSAVPEPATWMTMLFGFGLIGWRIRRGRAQQALAAQSSDLRFAGRR